MLIPLTPAGRAALAHAVDLLLDPKQTTAQARAACFAMLQKASSHDRPRLLSARPHDVLVTALNAWHEARPSFTRKLMAASIVLQAGRFCPTIAAAQAQAKETA